MTQDLRIDVSDEIEQALNRRAAKNGRTPEEEHRAILEKALRSASDDSWKRVDKLREELRASGRTFTDSTEFIRQDRDSR